MENLGCCRLCGAQLTSTGTPMYCSAEHRFAHSLQLLDAAATPHHGINPVEIERVEPSELVSTDNQGSQGHKRQKNKRGKRGDTVQE